MCEERGKNKEKKTAAEKKKTLCYCSCVHSTISEEENNL